MLKNIPLLSDSPAVIAAIDSELAYHNRLGSNRTDDVDHGVAGQIVTITELSRQLNAAWYGGPGEDDAIHLMRKIAASAIRSLILYKVSARLMNGDNGVAMTPEEVGHAS